MNPLSHETKELSYYFKSLKEMYPKPYNKNKTGPYSKTRVILMNGTEYESVWFMHQFARHCKEPEILESLAMVRRQEQWQQKHIACLKPLNESILETTISYEQLAIDLTASLAMYEKDITNKKALDFALLEDFDHLYRFSNLLMVDKKIDAKKLVGGFTEIMPGRPTIAEHRHPADDLKTCMNSKKSDLYSKLVACTITAAEQQTMNYYMNISQWYKNDIGRKLYSEIAMIEEAHVTQYESLKDPTLTWLEQWALHEYAEAYLYYSAYEDEDCKYLKDIWYEHFEMECAHLKEAVRLLKKYENKSHKEIFGEGEFPLLLRIGSHKDYIRDVIRDSITLTAKDKDYKDIEKLKDDDRYFYYQKCLTLDEPESVPSHLVIEYCLSKLGGEDYRYQDSPHPIKELQNRKKDNTSIARTKS